MVSLLVDSELLGIAARLVGSRGTVARLDPVDGGGSVSGARVVVLHGHRWGRFQRFLGEERVAREVFE